MTNARYWHERALAAGAVIPVLREAWAVPSRLSRRKPGDYLYAATPWFCGRPWPGVAHAGGCGGAARALSWPERRSASRMKPLAFRSSMNAVRNRMVPGSQVRLVPRACRICMNGSSIMRTPGVPATKPLTTWLMPAPASRPCSRKSLIPSRPRTTLACRKVRDRNRS
jgi:hypothetical protein